LADRFETEPVKAVLGFTSTFGTNAGPRTPGTAYVMAHHMFGGTSGIKGRAGYVRGGMGGLAKALTAAAAHFGAVLRPDAEVGRVLLSQGAVKGVELVNGERIETRAVVSNADPHRTFLGLVGRENLSPGFADAVQKIEMQGVALKVNCALKKLPRFRACPTDWSPARVSLCPSLEYMEEAWDLAKRGQPSEHPFMTVHMQSLIDDSLAPSDGHTLTCYAQYFPYNLDPSLGELETQRGRETSSQISCSITDRRPGVPVRKPPSMGSIFAGQGPIRAGVCGARPANVPAVRCCRTRRSGAFNLRSLVHCICEGPAVLLQDSHTSFTR
jgi:phytoene dehydrogenase-like protein